MKNMTAIILSTAVVSLGCFHATIDTGLTPSTRTIEKPFASAWIYGLVPPATVETASRCPDGVAKVETQQSFVNGLVNILTFGIYTPMNIKVTCAAGEQDDAPVQEIDVEADADTDAVQRAFALAADAAVQGKGAVLVRFD